MSRSRQSKLRRLLAALMFLAGGVPCALFAAAVNTISVSFIGSDKTFTAGVSTNSTGSGQIWIVTTPTHQGGGIVTLELLDSNGRVIVGGVSPSTFVDGGLSPVGNPAIQALPLTFYGAGTGLQLRATNQDDGKSALSVPFTVQANAPARLVPLLPGMTFVSGPGSGVLGTPERQQPNQPFSVTVYITDDWFNPVAADHVVAFGSGDLVQLPAPGPLANGVGTFNVTVVGARSVRTITVSDQTDPAVKAGTVDVTTEGPPENEVFPFPSPFNPAAGQSIRFRFRLAGAGNATVRVKDIFGQGIWERTVPGNIGFTDVSWDGRNDKGTVVAAGVYYVLLEVDGALKSTKRFGVKK